jgi:hypothetical protein
VDTSEVTITVTFHEKSGQQAIQRKYRINHMPIVNIGSEEIKKSTLLLDASSSIDPEGKELLYTWFLPDSTHNRSQLIVLEDQLIHEPVLLCVTDRLTVVCDIITYDPITKKPIFTPEKLECTDMQVKTRNASLLNPEVTLGPVPPPGTQLVLDANKKTTRTYTTTFAFEVHAAIKPSANVLDEGQDIAVSWSPEADNPGKKQTKPGRRRKEPNRSEFEDGEKRAYFPDPIPADGTHPEMVSDNYDDHPAQGFSFKNGADGVEVFAIKGKGLINDAGVNKMVWFDQPGFGVIPAGSDMSHGHYYRAYFRAWMKDKIPPCEKFFMYEMEIDKEGKVVKNELKMR